MGSKDATLKGFTNSHKPRVGMLLFDKHEQNQSNSIKPAALLDVIV